MRKQFLGMIETKGLVGKTLVAVKAHSEFGSTKAVFNIDTTVSQKSQAALFHECHSGTIRRSAKYPSILRDKQLLRGDRSGDR